MPIVNGNAAQSEDAPTSVPAKDYLTREVLEQANAVLWRRREAARKKYEKQLKLQKILRG